MQRWFYFTYGTVCHLLFLGTYVWLAAFVADVGLPKTIDRPAVPYRTSAVLVNLALILLFAVQHSVMSRPAFKRVWTRIVPAAIERSTYVLLSCIVLGVLIWQWRPLDQVIWEVRAPVGRVALHVCQGLGWLLVPAVTLMIDHFDLFGTRQVWLHLRGRQYMPLAFGATMLYRYVRHPLYLCWGLAFWATPTMTVGHLLFAGALSVYMGLAAQIEERDLIAQHGHDYLEYRRRVGQFIPRLRALPATSPNRAATEANTI